LALGYFIGGKLVDKKPDWKIFYSLFFIVSILFLVITLIDGFILDITSNLGIMWGPLVAALLLFFLPLGVLGMVTPFAVRLRTKSVENVGKRVGNFYAISTSGSIIGALAVAYYLIPNFKISVILVGSAAVLFLVSAAWFIFNKKGTIATISVLLIGGLLVVIQPAEKADANVLEQQQSFYGDIEVEIISTDLTCIMVNSIPQSCFNPDLDGSAASYTKLMVRALEQIDNPQKVLVVGDGGGLISREILKKYNDIEIDAVDIDGKIFELGEKYLHFEDSLQVNKIVADGRKFLQDSAGDYDAILIDAFTDSSPVLHLYTEEMFGLAKEKMIPEGVLVLNSFGFDKGEGTEVTKSLLKTSDQELERLGRVFEPEVTDDIPVITDNFNPLELYSLAGSEELISTYAIQE